MKYTRPLKIWKRVLSSVTVAIHLVHAHANLFHSGKIDQPRMLLRLLLFSPAIGYSLSVLFIILQIVDDLLVRGPRALVASLSSFHHWLFGCGSVSVLRLNSLRVPLCGGLRLRGTLGHLQHHCGILWAVSTPITKIFIAATRPGVIADSR